MKARVLRDPQGRRVGPPGQGPSRLAPLPRFPSVEDVRLGKYFEVTLGRNRPGAGHTALTAMCQKLLANTVIENYRVELAEVS